jgi:hypothetical protein
MLDLPIVVSGLSRAEHQAHHTALHRRLNGALYSADYPNLQAAVDDMDAKKRPLIIAPDTHVLTEPLRFDSLIYCNVDARGAFFRAGADMPAMLDMPDCRRCHWHGGWFTVPANRIVDNVIYCYRDAIQCTGNTFNEVMIEGAYKCGIRVGKPGSVYQCDHTYFTNIECNAAGLPGQVGIHVGTGVYGNCLNHHFVNLHMGSHETHVYIDQTNVSITNADFDTAERDLYVAAQAFSIRNVRSEDSQRFMVTAGPASYVANLTVDNVIWNADSIAEDGEWLQAKLAGYLKLSNVRVVNAAHPPVIRSYNGMAALRIAIDGLTTNAAAQDAFVLPPQTTVRGDYIQHAVSTAVMSITTL